MKPLLIGMNNPVSSRPGFELYPLPTGCTGHRIYEMLREILPDIRRDQYLTTFERRNLVVGPVFDKATARNAAADITKELWGSRRTVVLFGRDVQLAFGIPPLLVTPQLIGGTNWIQVPHPSGRNLWFNDTRNRRRVGRVLAALYEESTNEAAGV